MVPTYRGDRAGLRVPRPHATDGVLSLERRCRRQMTLGWLSGRGAVRCGHSVGEDLPGVHSSRSAGETKGGSDGRTGRFCVLVEGPDAAQTGARLYLYWVGDGRDGSRISRQGTVCDECVRGCGVKIKGKN
jgi:hypothetical protein